MNVFLDTSSLVKLYYADEDGGYTHNKIMKKVNNIYLSKLTELEFVSVIMRKFRDKKFSQKDMKLYLNKLNPINKMKFITFMT